MTWLINYIGCWIGLIENIITILTLGFFYPNWYYSWVMWWEKRKTNYFKKLEMRENIENIKVWKYSK